MLAGPRTVRRAAAGFVGAGLGGVAAGLALGWGTTRAVVTALGLAVVLGGLLYAFHRPAS